MKFIAKVDGLWAGYDFEMHEYALSKKIEDAEPFKTYDEAIESLKAAYPHARISIQQID